MRREAGDGVLFREDATFCPTAGSGGVRLSSANFPGSFAGHIDAEVWLARQGGGNPWDNPAAYTEDTTWAVAPPWAP